MIQMRSVGIASRLVVRQRPTVGSTRQHKPVRETHSHIESSQNHRKRDASSGYGPNIRRCSILHRRHPRKKLRGLPRAAPRIAPATIHQKIQHDLMYKLLRLLNYDTTQHRSHISPHHSSTAIAVGSIDWSSSSDSSISIDMLAGWRPIS